LSAQVRLSLQRVSKSYWRGPHETVVLREISLSVYEGECVAVWGQRGSGKTTLLKVAAGLEAPESGVVSFNDQDLRCMSRAQLVRLLREEIGWFDRRPLFGRTIVVTRAREQQSQLRVWLEAAGANVIEAPAIRIEPLDQAPLRRALADIARYQWLVVTSRNAVDMVWSALRDLGLDARALAATKLCAVGPATASALLEHGLAVDVIPERYVAEGVIEKLRERDDVRGARVLFARAAGARDLLPTALREMGTTVDEVEIYAAVPDLSGLDTLRDAVDAGRVDLVTFTSASTVRYFVEALGAERARTIRGASMGPITSDAARSLGVPIEVEAPESTIASLVGAIIGHLVPA